jgi:RND family efflux transporter MFP subunit
MRTLLVLILLAAIAGGGWWWYQTRQDAGEIRVLETAVLETGEVREVLEATGIVKSQVGAVVKIGVRATGEIVELPYRVGDRVDKGQLIAAIDDRELQAQLDQALADLENAKARAEYAAYDLERQRELYDQNLVDRDTLEEAEENLRIREAEVDRRQAEVEAIRVRLSYTNIYSPIDGVVSQVTAQEGETVVTGLQVANLITVLDPTRLEMWIYMDETDVGRVKPGQRVEFSVDAYPDTVFESRVDQIYPQPEIRDNIVYYQVLCPITEEQAELLRPEMTTQCRVIVTVKEDVLALPNTALKWVGGEQAVFRTTGTDANATVEKITEETGLRLGLRGLATSEVLEGLSAGDRVATQLVLPEQETAPGEGGGR